IDRRQLDLKLRGVLEIYEKFVGDDPRDVPMRIFPAVHYSMGGLWVNNGLDDTLPKHMTNIPGLFAVGECDYQYHGANRLGANSLLSCLTTGQLAGPEICKYADGLESHPDGKTSAFAQETQLRTDEYENLKSMSGPENPFQIWRELGTSMTENMTVVRFNDRLQNQLSKLDELDARYEKISVSDAGGWTNQTIPFTRQLKNMLVLARVMTKGALQRDESRGAHYKPDFPDRDDENFLKTTVAEYTNEGPRLSYEAVDTSQVKPRPRVYTSDSTMPKAKAVVTKNGFSKVGGVTTSIAGEEVAVNGGNGVNDPIATTPAGQVPRDGGGGTENSKNSPNMADIKPGMGGAN
ncbi:FAD-binding protein, partial [bacterium]